MIWIESSVPRPGLWQCQMSVCVCDCDHHPSTTSMNGHLFGFFAGCATHINQLNVVDRRRRKIPILSRQSNLWYFVFSFTPANAKRSIDNFIYIRHAALVLLNLINYQFFSGCDETRDRSGVEEYIERPLVSYGFRVLWFRRLLFQ